MQVATIQTTTGITNKQITKFYRLDLNEVDEVNLGVKKSPTVQLSEIFLAYPGGCEL